jgi:hypothetical protein
MRLKDPRRTGSDIFGRARHSRQWHQIPHFVPIHASHRLKRQSSFPLSCTNELWRSYRLRAFCPSRSLVGHRRQGMAPSKRGKIRGANQPMGWDRTDREPLPIAGVDKSAGDSREIRWQRKNDSCIPQLANCCPRCCPGRQIGSSCHSEKYLRGRYKCGDFNFHLGSFIN